MKIVFFCRATLQGCGLSVISKVKALPYNLKQYNMLRGHFQVKHSIGYKQCGKCGNIIETDLRGGAKWCFACKAIVRREYQRDYKRGTTVRKEQTYAAS